MLLLYQFYLSATLPMKTAVAYSVPGDAPPQELPLACPDIPFAHR